MEIAQLKAILENHTNWLRTRWAKNVEGVRADLSYANLNGADLSGANLSGANLISIFGDLIAKCFLQPKEVAGLRQFLIEGKVDGSVYEGECACFVGSLRKLDQSCKVQADSDSFVERWFLAIKPGDTPQNSQVVAITVK